MSFSLFLCRIEVGGARNIGLRVVQASYQLDGKGVGNGRKENGNFFGLFGHSHR
jgi:hypothetical protein